MRRVRDRRERRRPERHAQHQCARAPTASGPGFVQVTTWATAAHVHAVPSPTQTSRPSGGVDDRDHATRGRPAVRDDQRVRRRRANRERAGVGLRERQIRLARDRRDVGRAIVRRVCFTATATVAAFVTDAGAFGATVTGIEMIGSAVTPASTSARVQVATCPARAHVHPVPLTPVGVSPAGTVSTTVSCPTSDSCRCW